MNGKAGQLESIEKTVDRDAIRARVCRDLAAGENERYERTASYLENIANEIRAGRANRLVLEEAGRLIRLRAKR
jgi:hypothetical protein